MAKKAKPSRSSRPRPRGKAQPREVMTEEVVAEAALQMWKHVLKRLTLAAADGVSKRQAAAIAGKRRIQLVELIIDVRTTETRTRRELTKVLKSLASALQSTVDTVSVSYASIRPMAKRLVTAAADLLPLVRNERRFLVGADTTGNDALDAIMNMSRKGGRPRGPQAIAILADRYGLDALDVARLESVMIVGVAGLPEHLRLPPPDDDSVGLYLSTAPPVFSKKQDLRSRRFTDKWTEAFRRALSPTKPSS